MPNNKIIDLSRLTYFYEKITTYISDLLSNKQDTLVSGNNIKTINGESILGSGNITIEGGSGSSDANVAAVDTQETIDSIDGFKTINGESILGSGNIEINVEGDGVYITPFSVQQFCTGWVVELTGEQRNELLNAASQNRIIGMPYGDYGSKKGYIVTDYKYFSSEDDDNFWGLDLGVIYNGAHYKNNISSVGNINFTSGRATITPFKPLVQFVTVENGVADVSDDVSYTDNCIFWVEGECTELYIYLEPSEIGKTVRFFTGENCTLEFGYPAYWANGEVPTIEPYTNYELSLVMNMDYAFNAVLTPFKSVE